jgi:hypothetical protein
VMWAAVDDGQRRRRRPGEGRGSEQRKLSGKVCAQRKSEGARDSRTCSGSRRRRDRVEVGAGASAARVAARRGSDGGSATWGMWG